MAALTIFSMLFISIVFTVDFVRTILEIQRERAALKAIRLKTKAGGFSV